MIMIVLLSFFHTKIGPKIFYTFPERELDRELSERLYDENDETTTQIVCSVNMRYHVNSRDQYKSVEKQLLSASRYFRTYINEECLGGFLKRIK